MPTDPQVLLNSASCFLCLGMSIGDAIQLAQLFAISQSISPSPPGETFFRISNVGDNRISAVGDNRIYQ